MAGNGDFARRSASLVVLLAFGVRAPAVFGGTIQNFEMKPAPFPAGTSAGTGGPMTVGADGNLYVLDNAHQSISRVTPPGNSVTRLPLAPSDFAAIAGSPNFVRSVLAGTPDGKIWFTEVTKGIIGYVDPNHPGTSTFTVSAQGPGSDFAFIQAIGAGPDGNIWFGETGSKGGQGFANVGRLIANGVKITRFPLPTGAGNFGGITAGPDGNVWATLSGTILRINPSSGTVVPFFAPGLLDTITTGPDRNLWTTEIGLSKVLRITPSGTMKEFATPEANADPVGITSGPDGNLWFCEKATHRIVRLNLSAITPAAMPGTEAAEDEFDETDPFDDLTIEEISWLPDDVFWGLLLCDSGQSCSLPQGFYEEGECSPPTISGAATQTGKVGTAFSKTITISGGTPPYLIFFEGDLPDGLSFEYSDTSVTISGRPTESGLFEFTVSVVDADDCEAFEEFFLGIESNCPPIDLAPPVLPDGTIGKGYSQKIVPTAGLSTGFTFEVTGNLPRGVTATQTDAARLTLSGTPTKAGDYTFTVKATDAFGCSGSRTYTIHVGPCPEITLHPASLPNANQNKPYNFGVTATGGKPPYTYSATGLPAGMSINPMTGAFGGSPAAAGVFNITVMVTDANGCPGSKTYKITVKPNCPPITLSVVGGYNATVGDPFTATYSAAGGAPPYTFTGATTCPGLAFSGPVLAGTPTMAGVFFVFIGVTDANGCPGFAIDVIKVGQCPPITISPADLPAAPFGAFYFQTLSAAGGTPPYTFVGAAPAGLTLFPNGAIGGVPAAGGSFTFTVTVIDLLGCTGTANITIDVPNCAGLSIAPASLPDGLKGQPFSQTVSATGGQAPYHYSTVIQGSLPPGLSISGSTGKISGTPTADGTFGFTVSATDSKGCHVTRDYTVVIDSVPTPNLSVTKTADVATAHRGDTVTYTITISNPGTAPTSGIWTATDFLPPGLSVTNTAASNGSGLSCQTGGTKIGAAVVCSATTPLPVGASATITIVTTVSQTAAPGPAVNSVSLYGGSERREDDDQATATVEIVLPRSDGGVTPVAPKAIAKVGRPGGR